MGVTETLVVEITKRFLAKLDRLFPEGGIDDLTSTISIHIKEIESWSQELQIFEMKGPRRVSEVTIEVPVGFPRRLGAQDAAVISENDLLLREGHFVILGSPGCGKTTMLKRLVQKILSEPVGPGDRWQYPVLIRLQRLEGSVSLTKSIAEALGVQIKCSREMSPVPAKDFAYMEVPRSYIGDRPLEDAVPEILEKTGAILLLDGLDEVPPSLRQRLEQQIIRLAEHMPQGKILVTCRSGASRSTFFGYQLVEMCPLQKENIEKIARLWLPSKAEDFLRELTDAAYHDLAANPLFLSYLLVYFENCDYLPAQPKHIYPSICRLALEEWDRQRGVTPRTPNYAGFRPERKLEFLAALSYELTFHCRTRRFSEEQLRVAYWQIHETFQLPQEAAAEVVGEIESHTGIIVKSGYHHYEFSHASLQDYLCAYYLVRLPFGEQIDRYLQEYPTPVAVAVSLAANSSVWLAGVFLSATWFVGNGGSWVQSFFLRLFHEKPSFTISDELGFGILRILFLAEVEVSPFLGDLLGHEAVKASLRNALLRHLVVAGGDSRILDRLPGFVCSYKFSIPERITLSSEIFDRLLLATNIQQKGFDFTPNGHDRYELIYNG
jgi:hypothetical protein